MEHFFTGTHTGTESLKLHNLLHSVAPTGMCLCLCVRMCMSLYCRCYGKTLLLPKLATNAQRKIFSYYVRVPKTHNATMYGQLHSHICPLELQGEDTFYNKALLLPKSFTFFSVFFNTSCLLLFSVFPIFYSYLPANQLSPSARPKFILCHIPACLRFQVSQVSCVLTGPTSFQTPHKGLFTATRSHQSLLHVSVCLIVFITHNQITIYFI